MGRRWWRGVAGNRCKCITLRENNQLSENGNFSATSWFQELHKHSEEDVFTITACVCVCVCVCVFSLALNPWPFGFHPYSMDVALDNITSPLLSMLIDVLRPNLTSLQHLTLLNTSSLRVLFFWIF